MHLVSEDKVDAEDVVRSESLHFILPVKRFTCRIYAYEPVCIGLLWISVEYRIQDVTVYLFKIVILSYIYKVIADIRDIRIILQ